MKILEQLQALSGRDFPVILADPPWKFMTWSHRGQGKGASQHYPTMSLEEICDLPVADVAAPDCTLFLWGCWPHLPDALEVIRAWGFTYCTCGFVWVKQNKRAPVLWADLEDLFLGLGYGTRGNTEFCLRARRGSPKKQDGANSVPQLILSPVREHSRKPDVQYERIEALYEGPYLEMFARTAWRGWTATGDQVGRFAATGPKPQEAGSVEPTSDVTAGGCNR